MGGCLNCVALEGLLQTKHNERHHAATNVVKAHERCIDSGAALNKIANNLQQAYEELCRIEMFVDATNDYGVGEASNMPEIIRID